MSELSGMNAGNLQSVMKDRCVYYERKVTELRNLVSGIGVSVETMTSQRSSAIQFLAVDLASDFSAVARVKLEIAGSTYYLKMLDDFSWFLKDVRDSLRLYAMAEV